MCAAMSQAQLPPGHVISHYRIVDKIGAGGMGVVYRAHDEQLDRDVALKVLPAGLLAEDGARKQFRKEALALAKLNHPNIETIYEFSSDKGMDFLAMELIRGEPMDQVLDKGPMDEPELIRLATQFAEGLAAAHEQGVIHRDLKPANLFVTPDGRIKILDFGLAKLFHPELTADATRSVTIETGSISGTVPYMSPEQLRGLPVDVRSDIYAAGAVLFEMATGKRPYPQTQTAELMGAILLLPLPPPSSVNPNISPRLERVISKSLQKEPGERYQSARELRAALLGMNSAPTIANMAIPELATIKLQPASSARSGVVAPPSPAMPASATAEVKSGGPRMVIAAIAVITIVATGSILLGLNFHGLRDRIFKSHSGGGVSDVQPPKQPETGGTSPQEPPPAPGGQPEVTPQPENPRNPPVVPVVQSKTRRPVAVIGFKNVSGAADDAWLSTAFSEAMTSDLAGGGKLLAIPTDTVAQMKTSLALSDADSYGKDKLAKIRENLGTDRIVLGSYQTVGKGDVKLDLKLADSNSGEILASASGTGKQAEIPDLVARTGSSLREKLGVGAMSGAEASIAKASLPSNPQAARLYSEGLAKMRAFDYTGAREVLQKAVAEEPGFAFTHAALATAWESLGNEAKMRDEANQAFRLAGGLGQDDKLLLEARYHGTIREYDKAVQIYLGLFGSSPDNVEYGLKLARAQIRAGKAQDALATVEVLRKAPTASGDPRIDEMQAYAAQRAGDYKTERSAATRAAEKAQAEGARLVEAAALLDQSWAFRAQGQTKEAITAAEESQRIFASAGDRAHVASALHATGAALEKQGASEPARAKYQEARLLDDEIGNRESAADEYSSIARVFASHGFLAAAQKILEQAVTNYRASGNDESASIALASLGDVFFRRGDLKAAQDKYDESMGIVRNIGVTAAQGSDFVGTSRVLFMQGDLPGAMKQLDAAAPVAQRSGDKMLSGMISLCKGDIFIAGDELAEARKGYEAAAVSFQDAGDKRSATAARVALARLTIEEGHPADAEAPLRLAIEEFGAEKNPAGETNARAALASALLATGLAPAEAEAQKEMNAAIPYVTSLQDPRPRLEITITAARVATAVSGDPGKPRKLLEGALADATHDGLVPLQFEARYALAEILMKVGKSGQGRFQLAALEKDSTAKGFLLIARKSHAAAGRN